MTFLSLFSDLVLIGLLGTGIFYAVKLTRQLSEIRANHAAMERFVAEFNATVLRAEAGIRGLKNASRQSGDDLESLIEKGHALRDELQFLVESADQLAARLSEKASTLSRTAAPAEEQAPAAPPSAPAPQAKPASNVERELLNLLKKSG